MVKFVLDCSIAANWFVHNINPEPDEYSKKVLFSLNSSSNVNAIVPHLWSYELMNVMSLLEKNNICWQKILNFLNLVETYAIQLNEDFALFPRELLELASQYQLTGYDAAYLHLALHKGLPIATRDKKLMKAMQKAKISLLEA